MAVASGRSCVALTAARSTAGTATGSSSRSLWPESHRASLLRAAGGPRRDDLLVHAKVVGEHSVDGESPFRRLPAEGSVECRHARDGGDRLVGAGDEETGHALVDDL